MTDFQTIYQNTLKFAAEKHSGQRIPSSDMPYVVHLANVAMEIMVCAQHSQDFNLDFALQVALLHDVLEDTETSESEIATIFGKAVCEGVKALTKNKTVADPMADSLERIKLQPEEVWAVKLADRVTNLQRPPAHWNALKIRQYRLQAIQILDELKGGNPYLENRLRQKIDEYGSYC